MPPTTTIASGFWACEPIEVAMAAGNRPRTAVSEVITTGPTRSSAPRITASRTRHAARAHLVEVRDQEHAVLHGDAEDRDEPDRRRDAERRAGQPQAQTPPIVAATTLAMTSRASFIELNAV